MPAFAPGRFSITTGWPIRSCNRLPTMRDSVSGKPPAGFGTMIRIGWVGYCCADAKPGASTSGEKSGQRNAAEYQRNSLQNLPGSDLPTRLQKLP